MSFSIIPLVLSLALAGCEALPGAAAGERSVRFLSAAQPAPLAGLMASDTVTTTTRRLLSGPEAWASDVSADGGRVLTTDLPATGNLAIRDLATGQLQPITGNPQDAVVAYGWGFGGRYSPDERQVAFWWERFDPPDYHSVELRVAAVDGQPHDIRTLYTLPRGSAVSVLDWSPDGAWLLSARRAADGTQQLILVPAAGGEPRVLKTLGWSPPSGAGFSPDGRHVAYGLSVRDDSNLRDVHVVAVDGSGHGMLVQHDADDYFLGWAADGHLFFSSDRAGTPGVWRLPVQDGRPQGPAELVRPDLWRIWGVGFDGQGRFYYTALAGAREVQIANIDASTGAFTLQGPPSIPRLFAGTQSPAWSPDGRHLAYLAEPGTGGAGSVWGAGSFSNAVVMVHSFVTGESRELRLPAGLQRLDALEWAADGQSLLLGVLHDQGAESLLRLDVQTGAVASTAVDGLARFAVVPGSRQIALRRTVPGEAEGVNGGQVVLHDLDSGAERIVVNVPPVPTPEPVHAVAVSPDGSTLAVAVLLDARPGTSRRGTSIRLYPIDGGEGRVVVEHDRIIWGTSLAFTADGSGLYFSDRFDDAPGGPFVRPWLVPVSGGEARALDLLPWMTTTIRPHPDGRRIATVSGMTQPEFWVMENIAPVRAR
jgi:Tol biopolymer transport system component